MNNYRHTFPLIFAFFLFIGLSISAQEEISDGRSLYTNYKGKDFAKLQTKMEAFYDGKDKGRGVLGQIG